MFRYLFDPDELRRNPLVSARFEAARETGDPVATAAAICEGIRRSVREAAAEYRLAETARGRPDLGERYATILLASAIERRKPGAVARELGISLRQFYRDRTHAYRLAAERLTARASAPRAPARTNLDPAALLVAQAQFYVDNANYTLAARSLEKVAKSTAEPARRVDALCRLSEILSLQGRGAEAAAAVETGREIAARDLAIASHGAIASKAQLDMSAAMIADEAGEPVRAPALWHAAISSLRSLGTAGGDRIKSLLARALTLHAKQLCLLGDPRAAFAELKDARAVLQAMVASNQRLAIEELLARAWALGCTLDADFAAIESLLAAALDKAQRNGLAQLALDIARTIALDEAYIAGRRGDARARMRECVALALALGDATIAAGTCISAAGLEMQCADFTSAERLLSEAERLAQPSGLERVEFFRLKARAALNRARYSEALDHARTANAAADRLRNFRFKGSVLRIEAQTYDAMGRKREAAARIGEAIALLEPRGNPTSLAIAYRLSAKITGNAAHARLADSIARAV